VPDPISAGLQVAAEGLKIIATTHEAKNAPDVKAAAIAQDEEDVRAAATKAVAEGDLDEMRKLVAE
jgi:hypothetical protein